MHLAFQIKIAKGRARSLKKHSHHVKFHKARGKDTYFVSPYSLEFLKSNQIKHHVVKTYSKSDIPVEINMPSQAQLFDAPQDEAVLEVLSYALSKRSKNKKTQVLFLGRKRASDDKTSFIMDRPGGTRNYYWKIPRKPKAVNDIRDLFPKIVKKIRDPDTKFIVSFGSGGVRLVAHSSLMKFLEIMKLRPFVDEVWGCSGGAIAGYPYAIGIDPIHVELEGYNIYNKRYNFSFSPSKINVLKNIISDTFLPSKNMIEGFHDCQSAIQSLIEKYLDQQKINTPFYCIAYNIKRKRTEILTPEKVTSSNYNLPIYQTKALDAIVASSSIPIIYVPKKILRGKHENIYVDGGTTEEVPILSPYRKWIDDRHHLQEKRSKLLILAVNLFPEISSSGIFTHWALRQLPLIRFMKLSANYADLIRKARIDEHKAIIQKDHNATIWELKLPMSGANVVNTKIIPDIIELAQKAFFKQLMDIENSL